MCSGPDISSARGKVRNYRARLRARGLRPIQILVATVRAPSFKAPAHCQSLEVAGSAQDAGDQAYIDAVSDWGKG